ncbi:MAG: hypothetical protein ACYCO3_17050, partial [Mycobacteriales bacterium]
PPPRPAWESVLSELLAEGAETAESRFALQIALVADRAGGGAPRVVLRPLVRGRKGWVKTGASWRELEYRSYASGPRDRQREVLLELLRLARARSSSYYPGYYAGDTQVHLDEAGPSAWALLEEARRRGIELVGSAETPQVHLVGEPARVLLDLRRCRDGQVELRGLLADAGGEALPAGALLIGNPAHGLAAVAGERLELRALQRPLEAQTRRLFEAGLVIPQAELPRFLATFYPALRRRLDLISSDSSVSLPEIAPPRLLIEVEFAAAHTARIRPAFGYRVGEAEVRVGVAEAGGPGRDRDAEQALLAGLAVLERIPGLRDGQAGAYRLAPEVELRGLATARFVQEELAELTAAESVEVTLRGEPATYAEAREAPLITVSARDSADPDWFDLHVVVSVDGEEVPFTPLFTAL